MDYSTIVIAIIIVAMLAWSLTRRKKVADSKLGIAEALVLDINFNLKTAETIRQNYRAARPFRTGAWKASQGRMGFLESELSSKINEAFMLADDLNQRIQTARKSKPFATLQDLPLDKLEGLFNKSREGLYDWAKVSDSARTQQENRPGCSGLGF